VLTSIKQQLIWQVKGLIQRQIVHVFTKK